MTGYYTLMIGFLIRQYTCQYTLCILSETGVVLKVHGRLIHGSVQLWFYPFCVSTHVGIHTYSILHESGGIMNNA